MKKLEGAHFVCELPPEYDGLDGVNIGVVLPGDDLYITHPDRRPMYFNAAAKTWSVLEPSL